MDESRFRDQLVVFVKADKTEGNITRHIRFIAESGIIVLLNNKWSKSDICISSVFSSCIEFISSGEEREAERISDLVLVYSDADIKADKYMKIGSNLYGYRNELLSEIFCRLGVRVK